jgi:hypothetical protein
MQCITWENACQAENAIQGIIFKSGIWSGICGSLEPVFHRLSLLNQYQLCSPFNIGGKILAQFGTSPLPVKGAINEESVGAISRSPFAHEGRYRSITLRLRFELLASAGHLFRGASRATSASLLFRFLTLIFLKQIMINGAGKDMKVQWSRCRMDGK